MRYVFIIFAWVSIGFGYQIMAYGPDAWTSMKMVGHVLGWPVFFVASIFGSALSFGLWSLGLIICLIAALWCVIEFEDWRQARLRGAVLTGRHSAID
jgi:hypothetical protein